MKNKNRYRLNHKSLIRKLTVLLFGILAYSGCSSPLSKPCTLTPNQPPEMRGIKLGMTLADVKAKYPSVEEWGTIWQINPSGSPEFKGIRDIYYTAAFGKVSEITFYYDDSLDTSEEFKVQFFQKVQDSLNVGGSWTQPNSKEEKKIISCGRYRVEAGLNPDVDSFKSPGAPGWFKYEPYVKLEDVEAKAELQKTLKSIEAENLKKKREEFTP